MVEAIEILTQCVRAVMSTGYTIRIEERHQLEDKVLAQRRSAGVTWTHQKVQRAIENVGSGSLPRVDAR